jgi:RHS repeat-associated protein
VPGTPNQPYYYGVDQIGSVRRAFASTSSAPAYSYDAYGVPLQATAPVTDFVYGGMFYNADSGLYLTNYRAYDPVAGRWLSRDPLGETADPSGNLYPYVGGNPVSYTDPLGLFYAELFSVGGGIAGGAVAFGGSIVADVYTGGLNILATPAEIGAAISGGAAFGFAIGKALDNVVFSKGGKQNIRDTGLIGVSDEELKQRIKDPATTGKEKRRLQKEEKARGDRNKRKDGRKGGGDDDSCD